MVDAVKLKAGAAKFQLADLDMAKAVAPDGHLDQLTALQTKLQRIQQAYLHTGNRAVIVFEGWDASGKGGTIRRMSAVLDPRGFKVWPIGPPRDHEAERHYLARFWQRVPPQGGISVFDRSWYGRVLVERVEGFASEEEWGRAYDEINHFEQLLADDGARVVKVFLHVTKEEQARRFEARLKEPLKRWKLSYEDFRNRQHWEAYERAIEEMVRKTSTKAAPWNVVPANDKKYARLRCLQLITKALAKGVDLGPPPVDDKVRIEAKAMFGIDPLADGPKDGSNTS
jgi:polyphosphate kinase 2 (PPK2 family)